MCHVMISLCFSPPGADGVWWYSSQHQLERCGQEKGGSESPRWHGVQEILSTSTRSSHLFFSSHLCLNSSLHIYPSELWWESSWLCRLCHSPLFLLQYLLWFVSLSAGSQCSQYHSAKSDTAYSLHTLITRWVLIIWIICWADWFTLLWYLKTNGLKREVNVTGRPEPHQLSF